MSAVPLVSVVMSVYNGRPYMRAAVQSMLKQTLQDFELIIVNDGSTDGSGEVLNQLSESEDRIRVFHQENRGLAAALNRGIKNARGKYIARMDADDVSRPHRFERQIKALRGNPERAVVGAQVAFIDEEGDQIAGSTSNPTTPVHLAWRLLFRNRIFHPTWMAVKEKLEAAGGYNEAYETAQDYELITRLSRRYSVSNVDDVLVYMRRHGERVTVNKKGGQEDNAYEVAHREQRILLGETHDLSKSEPLIAGKTQYDVRYLLELMEAFIERRTPDPESRDLIRSLVAQKIWGDGRVLARKGQVERAETYLQICKETFGEIGVCGSPVYRLLARIGGGIRAERYLENVKRYVQ